MLGRSDVADVVRGLSDELPVLMLVAGVEKSWVDVRLGVEGPGSSSPANLDIWESTSR